MFEFSPHSDPFAEELARAFLEQDPKYSALSDPSYRMCENPMDTSRFQIAKLRECISVEEKVWELLRPYIAETETPKPGEIELPCDEWTKIALKEMYPHLLFLWKQRNKTNGQLHVFQKIMEAKWASPETIHIGYEVDANNHYVVTYIRFSKK